MTSGPQWRATRRAFVARAGAAAILGPTIAAAGAQHGAFAQGVEPASLQALAAGGQRSPANRARDPYRHPL